MTIHKCDIDDLINDIIDHQDEIHDLLEGIDKLPDDLTAPLKIIQSAQGKIIKLLDNYRPPEDDHLEVLVQDILLNDDLNIELPQSGMIFVCGNCGRYSVGPNKIEDPKCDSCDLCNDCCSHQI